MRQTNNNSCSTCPLKCDIFLTSKEMGLEQDLAPIHVLYKKHETICKQNKEISHAIVLIDGNAKIFIDGINNKKIILNILLPSNYIGLTSVFGSHIYSFNVSAITNCHTCHIDIDIIKKMYFNNQSFLNKLNQAFGMSVLSIMGKLISLNQKQVRGKVAESLLYLSHLYDSTKFILTITRKELGELSAISEENAVRVLTEFKNEGIIDMNGKEIHLKDTGLLNKISSIG